MVVIVHQVVLSCIWASDSDWVTMTQRYHNDENRMSQLPRLYINQSLANGQILDLEKRHSQRLVAVMRCREGDQLMLFNGDGCDYVATVVTAKKSAVTVQLQSSVPCVAMPSPCQIALGQVISRGERMDYAIQKATECGVAAITPLISDRCGVRLTAEKQQKRLQHWRAIAVSATEQCDRADVPVIHGPMKLELWIQQVQATLKIVGAFATESGFQWPNAAESVALVIGPEGGLTESELSACQAQDFRCVSFGPRVLRTETAPIVALTLLQNRYGDITG